MKKRQANQPELDSLREAIQELLNTEDMTQTKLGELARVAPTQISRFLSGERELRISAYFRLKKAIDEVNAAKNAAFTPVLPGKTPLLPSGKKNDGTNVPEVGFDLPSAEALVALLPELGLFLEDERARTILLGLIEGESHSQMARKLDTSLTEIETVVGLIGRRLLKGLNKVASKTPTSR